MGEAVWFFHHSGARHGPVSEAELRAHAAGGDLLPDDLVWQPEMSDWEPARSVAGLFPGGDDTAEADESGSPVWKARSSASKGPQMMRPLRPAQSAMRALQGWLTSATLGRIELSASAIGQLAYIVAASLACVLLVVIGIQTGQYGLLLIALAALPIALLLVLSSAQMLRHIHECIVSDAITVRSQSLLDGIAAAAFGSGLLSALIGLYLTVAGAGAGPLVIGVGLWLVLTYAAAGSLSPAAVNTTVSSELPAPRDGVASLAFVVRLLLLYVAPVTFLVATLAVLFGLVQALLGSIGDTPMSPLLGVGWLGRSLLVGLLPLGTWMLYAVLSTAVGAAGSLLARVGGSDR